MKQEVSYTESPVGAQVVEKPFHFLGVEEAYNGNYRLSVTNHSCFPTRVGEKGQQWKNNSETSHEHYLNSQQHKRKGANLSPFWCHLLSKRCVIAKKNVTIIVWCYASPWTARSKWTYSSILLHEIFYTQDRYHYQIRASNI